MLTPAPHCLLPLEVEELCHDMFAGDWCIRHGAVMALRDILKFHGAGAGRTADGDADEQNQLWLGDMTVLLRCIHPVLWSLAL